MVEEALEFSNPHLWSRTELAPIFYTEKRKRTVVFGAHVEMAKVPVCGAASQLLHGYESD